MSPQLGSSQVTALLETVPGIASVLRSPVADSLVNLIRAAAGTGEFRVDDAAELIQFAVRRGLLGADEGERITAEISMTQSARRSRSPGKAAKSPHRPPRKPAKRPVAKKLRSKKKR